MAALLGGKSRLDAAQVWKATLAALSSAPLKLTGFMPGTQLKRRVSRDVRGVSITIAAAARHGVSQSVTCGLSMFPLISKIVGF